MHRRMVRREADRARVAGEVVEAQRPRVLDQDTQDPAAARKVADRRPGRVVEPVGHEPLELAAGAVDHAERRVARAGQLGGDPDERLQDGVERQLRGDRDAGLDERAPSVVAVHARHSTCSRRARSPSTGRLHGDATGSEAADREDRPQPQSRDRDRRRRSSSPLALIAGSIVLSRGRRRGRRRDDRRPRPATARRPHRSRSSRASRRTGRCSATPSAKVRMLQFEDLQCPVCKTYTDDALARDRRRVRQARARSSSTSAASRSSGPTP